MAEALGSSLIRFAAILTVLAALPLLSCTPVEKQPVAVDGHEIDPMGPNGACYVCHIPFVQEDISKIHLAKKVTCVKCHGISAAHANDEDIGATKPDHYYNRD